MFCSKCGSQMSEEQAFCGNCGAPVREKRTDENVFAQMQMSNKKMVDTVLIILSALLIAAKTINDNMNLLELDNETK